MVAEIVVKAKAKVKLKAKAKHKVKAKGRGKVVGMDGVSVDLTGDEPLETVADLGVGPRTYRLYLISRLSLFPKNEGLSRSLSRSN